MSNYLLSPTPVAVDNQSGLSLAKNKTSHDSTKHIHFRFHYIRSLITSKKITLPHIDTNHNHAGILTKADIRDYKPTDWIVKHEGGIIRCKGCSLRKKMSETLGMVCLMISPLTLLSLSFTRHL